MHYANKIMKSIEIKKLTIRNASQMRVCTFSQSPMKTQKADLSVKSVLYCMYIHLIYIKMCFFPVLCFH